MSLFMIIKIKTALKMSVIKTIIKDLKKIRIMPVLTLILVIAISAFKVSVIKTVSEKRFN